MYNDAKCLAQSSAINIITQQKESIAYVDMFCSGFTCTSRSRANRSAAKNVGCVQRREEKTGEAFGFCEDFVARAKPPWVFLENVVGLAQDAENSDAAYIISVFKDWPEWLGPLAVGFPRGKPSNMFPSTVVACSMVFVQEATGWWPGPSRTRDTRRRCSSYRPLHLDLVASACGCSSWPAWSTTNTRRKYASACSRTFGRS
eukprot:3227171-Alexandrium_andersonii.AAC.1